ncbi:dicarboxylate/amino acid:cation symporter [Fictibacillus enclensis]|uniref:dicarboxylate/amino acid:cation symporter n=1 Tax=Fictibacillus enclensis TaxID=1017270 RepID=UPI0025A2B821|nr:dicarboxylate/amino acid:cation symporter [Fictibacillus enclensis]MDM5340035.1 dicarboxylate/amino acid:cation symporter [Fictibacillus enclensis]
MKKILKTYRFPLILLLSIVIGSIIGFTQGKEAAVLKPFGDLFLNAMFMIVVPLVFFSISSAIASMGGVKRFGKVMGSMMVVFLFTGVVASVIAMAGVKIYSPSKGVNIDLVKPEDAGDKVSIGDQIVQTLTVSDFSELFSRNNMLALILFSVLMGIAVTMIGEKGKPFASFLKSGSEVMLKMVSLVMYYAPIGLGAYFAALIGEFGPTLLGSYFRAVLYYYPLSIIYFFGIFTLYALMANGKDGVRLFWKNMLSPSLTALATCSSAASIPVNLEASKKMGVPDDISETAVPLGATLHKDGSVMGGVLKITFLFGIFGHDFSGIGNYLLVLVVSLLVGMVMGAIPQGGMIGEMLILSLFGFPVEALPIAAAISTIIDPPATLLNATGDNVASMLTARLVEGKKRMKETVMRLGEQKGA